MLKKMLTSTLILTFSSLAPAANPFSTKLTDPVIMKKVMDTNQAEVTMARLAKEKATRPEVKSFAEDMLTAHTENNQEAQDLSKKLKIDPSASMKTETASLAAEKDVAMLKMKKGAEFDKAYIEAQVKTHAKVLEDLNKNLIPEASNPELKAMLSKTATTVKHHLEEAQKIQNGML